MKGFKRMMALSLVAVAAAGCEDDDVTQPRVSPLAGNFEASAVTFADGTNEVDVVADGGSFFLDVTEEGEFQSTFTRADGQQVEREGTIERTGTANNVRFSDDPFLDDDAFTARSFTMTETGANVRLQGEGMEFDFDGDGVMDGASADVSLTPR